MWLLIFILLLCIAGFLNNFYLQIKRSLILRTIMDMENLITIPDIPQVNTTQQRERLVVVAHGGLAEELLGKRITAEKIQSMKPSEIEHLYATYEIRLGASMTKSLGSAAISLYARGAATLFPINEKDLKAALETDPFLNTALRSASCELFHSWGAWIAPLSVALITGRHIEQTKTIDIHNDNQSDRGKSEDRENSEDRTEDQESEKSSSREEINRTEGED